MTLDMGDEPGFVLFIICLNIGSNIESQPMSQLFVY